MKWIKHEYGDGASIRMGKRKLVSVTVKSGLMQSDFDKFHIYINGLQVEEKPIKSKKKAMRIAEKMLIEELEQIVKDLKS